MPTNSQTHAFVSPVSHIRCCSTAEIEAPVRGDAPDGGPPIRERENELDREIMASDGNRCVL